MTVEGQNSQTLPNPAVSPTPPEFPADDLATSPELPIVCPPSPEPSTVPPALPELPAVPPALPELPNFITELSAVPPALSELITPRPRRPSVLTRGTSTPRPRSFLADLFDDVTPLRDEATLHEKLDMVLENQNRLFTLLEIRYSQMSPRPDV